MNLPFAGRGPGGRGGRGGGGGIPPALAGALGRIGGPNVAALFGQLDDEQKTYAPTYFPGVASVAEAKPIALGLSEESLDNDFGLRLVTVSKIAGRVTNPDGSASTAGNITLIPDTAVERGAQFGVNYNSRIEWDGAFAISNVPPGRYLLRARSDDTVQPQFASLPLTVDEGDLADVTVILGAPASISGTVIFPDGQTQPDLNNIRIAAPSTEQQIGNQAQARVQKDGTFTIDGLPAGPHLIRPSGNLRGWTLRSVLADSRDITDTPVDLRSGQKLTNVTITFSDKVNEITGTMTNERSVPVTEYTVLAFSTESSFWRPQSRHIATARPDQTGKYRIRGLPPGEYYVTTVDPAEQGEWFEAAYLEEHRIGAGRLSLGEGETKSHDFKLRTQN